jgi:transposase InsO family protein
MILTEVPAAKYEIIREVTSQDDNLLNLSWMCAIAGVSRSGYYYWLDAEKNRASQEQQDERDFEMILMAFQFRGYDKGARGIHMRLLHLTPPVLMNVKKIRRLMKKFNLQCPIRRPNPYRRMAKEMQTNRVAPNLLNREFKAYGPRTVLLTDITYIPRRRASEYSPLKFSYLCVIMDAYTKQVLAYVVSTSIDVDFVLETVQQLMEKHGAELQTKTLVHSDQGCHYTCHKFIDILRDSGLRQSMSRRANCWDNAPQESFFGHMKAEIHLNPSDSHQDILRKVNDWIDYYNNDRYQWGLAKLSPNEFYQWLSTGIYPLGGAAPEPPEFTAFVSGEGVILEDGKEKDST